MPDNLDAESGVAEERRGSWRRKRKKRSFVSRMTQPNSARKKDYIISLAIVMVLLILVATGLSDKIWVSLMSFFESPPPQ